MKESRQKFLKLLKSRVKKYRPARKTIIEKKIDKLLAHNHVVLESVSGVTSQISVPYALIGGHAVAVHGTPRMTEDIDILTLPEYVDDIVDVLGIEVESPLTVGGVAGKTIGGLEIDVIAPDQKWVKGALAMAVDTPHGRVVSKPYLVLSKIWASRGAQDDTDIVKIIQNMDWSEKDATKMLVREYFLSMSDDIDQMIEIADLGIEL